MARGRKSAVSLAVVPPALPGERPAPPAALDDTEACIWRAIVGALPPAWLDAAAQEVLARAVAQASVCEGMEAQLRERRRRADPDQDAIATLAAQHAASAKAQLWRALKPCEKRQAIQNAIRRSADRASPQIARQTKKSRA